MSLGLKFKTLEVEGDTPVQHIVTCIFQSNIQHKRISFKNTHLDVQQRGRLVSVEFINNIQSIDIYKMVYISVKENVFEEQSATIYIPENYEPSKLNIWIHGTFRHFDDTLNEIGWLNLEPSKLNNSPVLKSFILSKTTNSICIAPDNVGYGVSAGIPYYVDTQTQIDSVIDSFIAFKFLCKTLKYLQMSTQPVKIYVVGYSLGGIFVPGTANELIRILQSDQSWTIGKLICGAPINGNSIVNYIYDSKLTTLISDLLFFVLFHLSSKKYIACQILKLSIYRDLLPLFSNLYSGVGSFTTKFSSKVTELISKGVIKLNNNNQILADSILNLDKLPLICEKELHNITNPFLDLTLLSNHPMYIVYSKGDPLCNLKIDNNIIVDTISELDTDLNGTFPSQQIQQKLNKPSNNFIKYEIEESGIGLTDIVTNEQNKYIRIIVNSQLNHTGFHNKFMEFASLIINS
jgi:hypothetical protein